MKALAWEGQFSFVDEGLGWAVAWGENDSIALVRTRDGGRTWEQLEPYVVQ